MIEYDGNKPWANGLQRPGSPSIDASVEARVENIIRDIPKNRDLIRAALVEFRDTGSVSKIDNPETPHTYISPEGFPAFSVFIYLSKVADSCGHSRQSPVRSDADVFNLLVERLTQMGEKVMTVNNTGQIGCMCCTSPGVYILMNPDHQPASLESNPDDLSKMWRRWSMFERLNERRPQTLVLD